LYKVILVFDLMLI